MIKLRKYLKGSGKTVVLILFLLILQAWCELELPTYTSKIVTTGDPDPESHGSSDARADQLCDCAPAVHHPGRRSVQQSV